MPPDHLIHYAEDARLLRVTVPVRGAALAALWAGQAVVSGCTCAETPPPPGWQLWQPRQCGWTALWRFRAGAGGAVYFAHDPIGCPLSLDTDLAAARHTVVERRHELAWRPVSTFTRGHPPELPHGHDLRLLRSHDEIYTQRPDVA